MKARPANRRRGITKLEVIVSTVIVCLASMCLLGVWLPFELVVWLAIGWIDYLYRVVPEVTINWSSVVLGITALGIYVVGSHMLFRSWSRAQYNVGTDSADAANWPVRRTMAMTVITLLLFVAGISMVGITHQLIWLSQADAVFDSGRSAERRTQSGNNLKFMALGTLDYHDDNGSLPFLQGRPPSVEPLHGWQTTILPYAELGPVYKIIDLSEPWIADANHEAMTTYVPTFASRGFRVKDGKPADWPEYGPSHYAANRNFLGLDAPRMIADITDGTSQTIFAGEVAANFRPWGHPANYRDPAIGINTSPDGFGSPWFGGANVNFADGSVRFLNNDIDPKVLRALATPGGGEDVTQRINGDW